MDTGIRLAQERDISALTKIWQICFHDSEDYIRFFYTENFAFISAAVYTVDDRPVSMLHWFDAAFVNGDERLDAKFLYAGGTHPAHRKKGYYGALFEYAKAKATQAGYALFGKPASRELLPYYQSFEFSPDACFRLVTVYPGEKRQLSVFPLAADEYNRLRDIFFANRPYAKWPDRYVRWCVAENEFFGGKTLGVHLDGNVYFLMGALEGDTLLITETNLSYIQLKQISGALCAIFGGSNSKSVFAGFCLF